MKNRLITSTLLFVLAFTISCQIKTSVINNSSNESAAQKPAAETEKLGPPQKDSGWQEMQLPDEFSISRVTFGQNGEIVMIGSDIRISKDDGKTWKIITEGKGFDRCTLD